MLRADPPRDVNSGNPASAARWSAGITTLLCALAWVTSAAAENQAIQGPMHGPPQDQASIPPFSEAHGPETPTPWLDEVRAQRQSWESKRDAARRAYEARRRANNPRAAAQQEAWEEDVQRRRAARRERMEQERELYRSLGPSLLPTWPWPNDPNQESTKGPDTAADHFAPAAPSDTPVFAPQGWDNHWYFRGF